MDLAGDTRLLLLPHRLQVRRQLAELGARLAEFEFDLLVRGDVPDHPVPDRTTILETARRSLDVGPAQFALAGEDAALPMPVAILVEGSHLARPVALAVVGMDQATNAAAAFDQFASAVADQRLAALADIGEVGKRAGPRALQAEDHARHVGGDALHPRLAFLQCLAGTAALGDVAEEHHQILGRAEAQEAKRDVGRQPTAVGAQAAGLEAERALLAIARTTPKIQPAVHVQAGLEVGQRTVHELTVGMAEHLFGGAVGVAYAAVPVDPEDAQGAVVDGELGQAQRLLGRLAQLQVAAGAVQPGFQRMLLAPLEEHRRQRAGQQQAEEDRQVLPEPRRLAEARILGLQPALVQLVQGLARQRAQRLVDHHRQFRPVATGRHPQQLRVADIANHR